MSSRLIAALFLKHIIGKLMTSPLFPLSKIIYIHSVQSIIGISIGPEIEEWAGH